ncbi:ASCH domain-containing protein [Vulcanisaeta distributa]|uniref:ASCH domain-containing protein n=1 Tax=Vulcanisaeta distributa TaxID=164451 RepID=UPI0006D1347F|nr:ASCH domain-containing protein [Vulcanisaeta distributa]
MRRVVYLGRHLMLKSKYLDKLGNGRFTTIRLGIIRPKYREVFIHSGGMVVAKARIVNVLYKRVSELTDEDAVADGFTSREALIDELRGGIYGNITNNDWVTILTLEVTKAIGRRDDGSIGLSPVDIARLALRYNVPLSEEERRVLQELVNEGSVRKAAVKLFNSLRGGRVVIRRIIRKSLKHLIRMGVITDY